MATRQPDRWPRVRVPVSAPQHFPLSTLRTRHNSALKYVYPLARYDGASAMVSAWRWTVLSSSSWAGWLLPMARHPSLPVRTWHPTDAVWAPDASSPYFLTVDDAQCSQLREWLHSLDDGEVLPVRGRDQVGDMRPGTSTPVPIGAPTFLLESPSLVRRRQVGVPLLVLARQGERRRQARPASPMDSRRWWLTRPRRQCRTHAGSNRGSTAWR